VVDLGSVIRARREAHLDQNVSILHRVLAVKDNRKRCRACRVHHAIEFFLHAGETSKWWMSDPYTGISLFLLFFFFKLWYSGGRRRNLLGLLRPVQSNPKMSLGFSSPWLPECMQTRA